MQEWDESNFLVDLSGLYANCEALKQPRGIINVDRKTRDGDDIGAFTDNIEGGETHVDATNNYITQLIKRWNSAQVYNDMVCIFFDTIILIICSWNIDIDYQSQFVSHIIMYN